MQEKLIQQYPKNSTDGFPNSENAEQTLTVKRIGGKLKITSYITFKSETSRHDFCAKHVVIDRHNGYTQ